MASVLFLKEARSLLSSSRQQFLCMVLTFSSNFAISELKWVICNKSKQREIWNNNRISVCTTIHLSVCTECTVSHCGYQSVWQSAIVSVHLSVCWYVCLPVYCFVELSICLSVYLVSQLIVSSTCTLIDHPINPVMND